MAFIIPPLSKTCHIRNIEQLLAKTLAKVSHLAPTFSVCLKCWLQQNSESGLALSLQEHLLLSVTLHKGVLRKSR